MPKKSPKPESAPPLRRKAEKRWKTSHSTLVPQAKDDPKAAIYELEVHQIELELQNEDLRSTQLQLTDARDSFQDLYDFAPVGYLTLDSRRVIRQANLTAATLLSVERSKLLGMRLERFVGKESRDVLYLQLQAAERATTSALTIRRGDGTKLFVRLESRTIDDDRPEGGHRIALIDVTPVREAEEELRQNERRFRALTEKSSDYITILDAAGKIIYENPSVNRSMGFEAGELVGHTVFDMIHPDDLPRVRRLFDEVRRKKTFVETEVRSRARDGSWRTMHVAANNLLDDPAVQGIVVNSRDVTDRALAVEELRRLNEVLDQRVRERTEAIQMLHDVASVANQAQNFKQAIDYCLQRLTATNGWRFGHALLPSPQDADILSPASFYYPDDAKRFGRFREATVGMTFRLSEGFPGRVFAERKPMWTTELAHDLSAPRGAVAAELKLGTAVAFPVLLSEKVVAVLEFFSDKVLPADERFTDVMTNVGLQLGRVVERATFEERLLAIADEVQQRIAQDLHDDLGQELTGLGLKAETLAERLEPGDNGVSKLAADVMRAVERAREKARSLARRILPIELDLGSLGGALEGLAAATSAGSRAACTFCNSHPSPAFEGRVATHLFRIAQEAVSNAIRHGEPEHIRIELASEDGRTVLSIADDGAGLPDEASHETGLGLRIMRYRAGLIGGALEIGPTAPRGVRVCCRLAPNGISPRSRRKRK